MQKIVANAAKYRADAEVVGVLVAELAPPATEVIVGALKDPQFGQTVMFGLGGIFVEMLKDVSFRVAPLTEDDAREMITQLKAYPLLTGYRDKRRQPTLEALATNLVQHFAPRHGAPPNKRTRPQPHNGIPQRRQNP